jgi:hypothetical protein
MRKRVWATTILSALAVVMIFSSALVAQRTRTRPAAAAATAPRTDLKITYRTSMMGQSREDTTMLKGSRERTEMKMGYGMDMINITQCDLKRTIQISDSARKYVITPMDTGDATPVNTAAGVGRNEPSRRGGVVTYTTSAVDTGERKEMFGFQARHVKTTMSIESSPDACNPVKQHIETDGWYIDFSFGLNCEVNHAAPMGGPMPRGGCRDTVRFSRQGAARTGYALQETTTSYGPDGSVAFTSTKEVIELSREPLDAALFDVPAGYTEASSTQELYAPPSMGQMAEQMSKGRPPVEDSNNNTPMSNTKAPGSIRVGVVQIKNKTDHSVSTESLRGRLVGEISGSGVEAVPLNAVSASEAEVEARAKQCDFILYTDLTMLKTSAAKSIGGFLGRATGVSSGAVGKTEAKVEFQLFAVGDSAARLKSAASGKEEGDEASAGAALDLEAKQVSGEARKKRN